MAVNHLGRSRKHWRDRGYYLEKVEHVQRVGGKVWRTDLHGFGDLVAVKPPEYVLIQVTSWKNVPSRVRKILEGEEEIGKGQWARTIRGVAEMFLQVPGHRVIVEGWRKKGGRWRRREHEITLEDLQPEEEQHGTTTLATTG